MNEHKDLKILEADRRQVRFITLDLETAVGANDQVRAV